MQRPSGDPYTERDPPGCNIHRLRVALEWSQRQLAEACQPPLDHTTVQRLERNKHYTSDSLRRVADALGVRVADLFLPPELLPFARLPERVRARLAETVAEVAAGYAARHLLTGPVPRLAPPEDD
jgi:transcriptional regulator with XRE-family HTH domain